MQGRGGSAGPEGARWVHVGTAYLYVDQANRLAEQPAPTLERERAEKLAEVVADAGDPVALAALEQAVSDLEEATGSVERLVALVEDLTRGADPETLAKYADPLLGRVIRDYRRGRFRDAARLARASLALYLLVERWRDLVHLLHLARQAADQVGDVAEAARAVHDLGVLAHAAGSAPLAAELFEQARSLFEQIGDQAAAEAVGPGAGLTAPAAAHTGVAVGVKVAAAVAGVLVVGVAATGFVVGDGVWFGMGGDESPEAAVVADDAPDGEPDAEIVAFAAGDDTGELGVQADRAIEIPEGAVGPGESFGACEPTYVYHYVRYENMATGTAYSGTMGSSSGPDEVVPRVWGGPVDSTGAFWIRRGTDPLPYGEWELVVEIDGVEVDRETFTLEEDCSPD